MATEVAAAPLRGRRRYGTWCAAGETRTRQQLANLLADEVARADKAERALRGVALERDRWRRRAEAAETELRSIIQALAKV